MNKMLQIAIIDTSTMLGIPAYTVDWSVLSEAECRNILKAMNFHQPTEDEVSDAINILLAHLYYKRQSGTYADVDIMNDKASQKEMTISEIEKELGHKVKIVKEKEE